MIYRSEGYYQSEMLDLPNIVYGFGTRAYTEDLLPITKQVHGSDVVLFDTIDPEKTYVADAFLSEESGILCKVRTADCLPLIICDRVKKIVGAVHCGWRGTVARIVPRVFDTILEMGSLPEDGNLL